MGRKHRTFDKDDDRIDRLRQENKKLKHQINQLRKQIARIDVDRYQGLKNLVDKQAKEDADSEKSLQSRKKLQEWKCNKCLEGHLRIVIINRRDGVYYFRRCSSCVNRTVLQRYTAEVEGVREDDQNGNS